MINLFLIGIIVAGLLATTLAAIWVYRDAKAKGLPAGLWAFLVVVTGNFVGLILYILIARRQESVVCSHCNMPTAIGAFCSKCGKELSQDNISANRQRKTSRGLLVVCIACIVVGFAFTGALMVTIFLPRDGFISSRSYSGIQRNLTEGTTGRGVRQRSSGNTWEVSFREASAGFTFSNFYRARTQPSRLVFDVSYTGYVRLTLSQGDISISEILSEGFHEFDMSAFDPGRIRISIENLYSGTDYSSVITVVSE